MSTTLKAITSSLGYQHVAPTTLALITPLTQNVRWRDDGVAPTAAIGMPLLSGVTLQYDGDLTRIQFIETTVSAELNVAYYA